MNKGYNKPKDYPYQECEILKINPKDNTITIKKIKDSWNRDEVIKLIYESHSIVDLYKYDRTIKFTNLKCWIEENL